jgi:DNA modification methylase
MSRNRDGQHSLREIDLRLGDCLEVLKTLPDDSVDSIVTDPPYGLSFMGKKWDCNVPGVDVWQECLRVLKPGGHLLAFAGTRTQHRMAVAIEDAGFEIRDMIAWVYGGGFPKSLDVSKAIDKAAGAEREVTGHTQKCGMPTAAEKYEGNQKWSGERRDIPATPAARQWAGWGTALKPAMEPITVARKPLIGTVAENVLRHGTGGINVDGCRVGTIKSTPASPAKANDSIGTFRTKDRHANSSGFDANVGRWPANLIHDGSDEVLALFPVTTSGKPASGGHKRKASLDYQSNVNYADRSEDAGTLFGDTGSAARYFYCAKASKKDRGEGNNHPTVKPTALMRYLVRLVTPPGGTVLDPFMGSGSTGKAAILEGFDFIGIELDQEYFKIAQKRIASAQINPQLTIPAKNKPAQTVPTFS